MFNRFIKRDFSFHFYRYQAPGVCLSYDSSSNKLQRNFPTFRKTQQSKTPTKEFANMKMENKNRRKKFRNTGHGSGNVDRSVNSQKDNNSEKGGSENSNNNDRSGSGGINNRT